MSLLLCHIITALSLALLVLEVVGFVLYYVKKLDSHQERVRFVRSFKDGKFIFVYIIAIPIYFVGLLYGGTDVVRSAIDAVKMAIQLVVFGFDNDPVSSLMNVSVFYSVSIHILYALVIVNVMMFAISVFREKLANGIHLISMSASKRPRLILLGNNKENISIYNSETVRKKEIVDKLSSEEKSDLYLEKCNYRSVDSFDEVIARMFSKSFKKQKKHLLIVNTGNDKENLEVCYRIIDSLKKNVTAKEDKSFYEEYIDVYVFGNPIYESGYRDVMEKGYGCIHYINKYQRVAMDCIEKYPYAKFLSEKHLDYSTSLIKEGVEINSLFIGFGKMNRQVFLSSVANNQLLHRENGKICLKKVNYYIFDKQVAEANRDLNHNYYRFENEVTNSYRSQCLPMPKKPANEEYDVLDISSPSFYGKIKSILTRSRRDVNFITIAFGDDLENMDMAHKLISKCREWEIESIKIFVRVKGWKNAGGFLDKDCCIPFGDEDSVIFNVDSITRDRLTSMAMKRDTIYAIEYDVVEEKKSLTRELVKEIEENTHRKWFHELTELERESNIYACLSIRAKLNLMGLDYCSENEEDKALTKEEYLSVYAGEDMPNESSVTVCGKNVITYSLDFKESRRKSMAIHEHERWNSFMLSRGFIPATKEQILTEKGMVRGKYKYTNGKSYRLRRHGCLTTWEGLVEFRKMIADRDGEEEIKKDVIKYDYQLLDDAYWLLTQNGYKIIRLAQ